MQKARLYICQKSAFKLYAIYEELTNILMMKHSNFRHLRYGIIIIHVTYTYSVCYSIVKW